MSLIFIFALATNLTTSHPANAQNKSQDKSQDTESAFIQRRIDENPVKPSADYSLSGYSAEDQVIRFSSPRGSDKIISIPFNLPSGVKTSVLAGRFLVIEDEGGSTFSGGALEHAKKIYIDLGSFFDRKNPNPKAKHSYLSEDGEFRVTSREFSRTGLYDESLDLTTSFFWNDLSKKKAIRDGYKMYKSKSGFTSVFYNPNGLPPLILGNNWPSVESIQQISQTSFNVRDHAGLWSINFKSDENTYSVEKISVNAAPPVTEKANPPKSEAHQ